MATDLDDASSPPAAHHAPGRASVPSSRPGRPSWITGAAVGGAAAAGALAIAAADPTDSGVPVCWSAGLFGIDCPLCGGLRCVNSLVRGDWLAAADHNLLLAVALPLIAAGWVVWMVGAVRGRPAQMPHVPVWAWWTLGVVVAVFTVVRNMDLGPVAHYLAATSG